VQLELVHRFIIDARWFGDSTNAARAQSVAGVELMRRRTFVVAFTLGAIGIPLAVTAQRFPRIGYLSIYSESDPRGAQWRAAFLLGLRELGYIDGQNVAIEYRYADGKINQLPALATDLVKRSVDVIVLQGDAALRATRDATHTTPIVVSIIGDLAGTGYVQSLARPGGNVTGITVLAPELTAKRMELLKQIIPELKQAGVLWNPANAVGVLDFKTAQTAARKLGIQLHSLEVANKDAFDTVFRAALVGRVGALIVLSDALMSANRLRILEFASKNKLPSSFEDAQMVREAGLWLTVRT
jgi:putative ABC transport system substrate-binding protein